MTWSPRPASAASSPISRQADAKAGAGSPSVCHPSARVATRRSIRSRTRSLGASCGLSARRIGGRGCTGLGSSSMSSNWWNSPRWLTGPCVLQSRAGSRCPPRRGPAAPCSPPRTRPAALHTEVPRKRTRRCTRPATCDRPIRRGCSTARQARSGCATGRSPGRRCRARLARFSGQRAEQDDRLQAGLGGEVVAHPHGVEQAGALGDLGVGDQVLDGGAEQDRPVGRLKPSGPRCSSKRA